MKYHSLVFILFLLIPLLISAQESEKEIGFNSNISRFEYRIPHYDMLGIKRILSKGLIIASLQENVNEDVVNKDTFYLIDLITFNAYFNLEITSLCSKYIDVSGCWRTEYTIIPTWGIINKELTILSDKELNTLKSQPKKISDITLISSDTYDQNFQSIINNVAKYTNGTHLIYSTYGNEIQYAKNEAGFACGGSYYIEVLPPPDQKNVTFRGDLSNIYNEAKYKFNGRGSYRIIYHIEIDNCLALMKEIIKDGTNFLHPFSKQAIGNFPLIISLEINKYVE